MRENAAMISGHKSRFNARLIYVSINVYSLAIVKVKVKERIAVNGTPSHNYGVSLAVLQCYLPPDTSERTPPSPQPDRLVLDLPTI